MILICRTSQIKCWWNNLSAADSTSNGIFFLSAVWIMEIVMSSKNKSGWRHTLEWQPHLADRMMTRASSSFASSSRAVKLVSWLNWRTFSACDRGIRKVKPATLPCLRHHAASLPAWFELGRFRLKKRETEIKKESDPGEPAELKNKKSLGGRNFCICSHANWGLSRLQRRTCMC